MRVKSCRSRGRIASHSRRIDPNSLVHDIAGVCMMNRALPLKGLTVLVTGGGRGIGRACVASCASAGARVIAVARTRADLESLRAEIGGGVDVHAADVTDPQFYRDLES